MPSFASRCSAEYLITRSFWGGKYDVSLGGRHVYHVDNSHLTPGKPDLTFHAGADTSARIVGVCKFQHFSSDTEIGLGNPTHPNSMMWERLTREGIMSPRYSFRVGFGDRRPQTFTWKRTHSLGSGMTGNLKLVHDESQQVVAVFSASNGFSRKLGELKIYGEIFGEQFQFMVLITGVALREKLRRSNAGAAGAAGGGAAGGGGGA